PFSPLAQGAIMAGLHALEDDRPRQAVAIAPGPALARGDIVLVIDESIAARYLDINHPAGVRSGLARARRGVVTANFGVAAAVTNCSAGSNLTLRYGGTRETYREAAEDMPSIWAYARRAGRRTVYLDAQRERGALQNLMTPAEAAEIDDFVQLGTTPVAERDRALARRLGARLGNGVAEFILVNKVGAHFPIADKFPLAAARYRPLPPRGRTAGITDIAALPGQAADSDEEWRRYRNAYRNTLVWSTAGFFDLLLPRVAGSGAVLLYTADHGQNLYERGGAGGPTHCVPEPAGGEEGAVPLVVIAAAGAEGTAAERGAAEPSTAPTDWRAVAAARRDAMSHFRIFPTLLALMGYESATTAPLYGPTLLSPEPDPMTFTPNYNASLGRDPSWYRVDPAALAAPPTGDYAAGTRDR
ncbi:MAG: sulfatase, partial [Alphaproteobacteria bacterium]|nr:sulfatase [Alphaproteobacteria bacterium]